MRRFSIFVITALLLTGGSKLVLAQHGGGHASSGHSVSSGGRSVVSSGFHASLPTRSPNRSIYPVTSVPIGATGINPGALSHGPYRPTRGGVGYRGGYGYGGYGYGGYGYYPYYPLFDDYNDSSYYNGQQPAYAAPDPAAGALGEQVDRLSAEVEALRNDQAQGYAAPAPRPRYDAPPMAADDQTQPEVPVTLVLRDGQQIQMKSYAVMGQEIWDFSAQPVKKVSLANVNLDASQKATEAAGGEFSVLIAYTLPALSCRPPKLTFPFPYLR